MSSYRLIYYCLIFINIRFYNKLMVMLTSWYHQTICIQIDWVGLSSTHTRDEVISIFYRKHIDKEKKKKSNSISSSHARTRDSSIQLVILKNENKRRKDLTIVNKIDRKLLFFAAFMSTILYTIIIRYIYI
jgi:hypothetical protein